MLHLNTQTTIILTAILLAFSTPFFAQTLTSPTDGATDVSLTPQLQWTGTSGNSTVEIFDCNDHGSSINLGNYQLAQGPIPISAIPNDLSGVTYNSLTNTLFMITNKNESIYETDLNGNLLRTITLQTGTSTNNVFYDTEDIVHISGNTFALVEERKGRVVLVDIFPSTTFINYSSADLIQTPVTWPFDENKGLEGVTYDPATGQFYVVKEIENKVLSTFNMPTSFPNTLGAVNHPCDLQISPFTVMKDAAAIHHLGLTSGFSSNDILDNFLILSEESKIIIETDDNCGIISSLNLSAINGEPEGITMDNNGNLYVVAEPNELYIYTNPNQSSLPTIHSATVTGNSYIVPTGVLQNNIEYCWHVIGNSNVSGTSSFTTQSDDGTITVCMPISTGADDIEEWQDGSMYTNSSDLELIYDANPNRLQQKIGLRFNDLDIPQASQIISADIQFTADEATSGTVNLTIRGEAADDASPFTTANSNLSNRATTAASVPWSPANWLKGDRSNNQKTPDLSNIIQEIVDRANYNSNSSMVFIVSGNQTTKRIAESYENDENDLAQVAELCITYFAPDGGNGLCIEPDLHIWMEGADVPGTGFMQTGLRDNYILPGQNIGTGTPGPSGQPYYQAPWNYPGTEGQGWGNDNYHADVVDWVFVSFRTGTAVSTEVTRAAALLHKDGSIHFPESCVIPNNLNVTSLYAVVDHRNHLVAMSHIPVPITIAPVQNIPNTTVMTLTYDFRQQDSYHTPTSIGQKQLPSGTWAMLAGDMDGNYDINGADKVIWSEENGTFGLYKSGDLNLNGDVNGSDKVPWGVNSGLASGVPQ